MAQEAADAYTGRPVTDVRIFIDRQPTTEAALVDLVETRAGQPLSMAAVRESISHLFTLGGSRTSRSRPPTSMAASCCATT